MDQEWGQQPSTTFLSNQVASNRTIHFDPFWSIFGVDHLTQIMSWVQSSLSKDHHLRRLAEKSSKSSAPGDFESFLVWFFSQSTTGVSTNPGYPCIDGCSFFFGTSPSINGWLGVAPGNLRWILVTSPCSGTGTVGTMVGKGNSAKQALSSLFVNCHNIPTEMIQYCFNNGIIYIYIQL